MNQKQIKSLLNHKNETLKIYEIACLSKPLDKEKVGHCMDILNKIDMQLIRENLRQYL